MVSFFFLFEILLFACFLSMVNLSMVNSIGCPHAHKSARKLTIIQEKIFSNHGEFIKSLGLVLSSFKSKKIAFTVVGGGKNYHSWTLNFWMHYASTNTIIPLLVIGTGPDDCTPYHNISTAQLVCINVAPDIMWLQDRKDIQKGWPVALKWFFSRELLIFGFENVLFLDADVIVLRDPFELFDIHLSYDVLGLSDQWRYMDDFEESISNRPTIRPKSESCNNMYALSEPLCQSTGIMYMRRTLPTLYMLQYMVDMLEKDSGRWEQDLYNFVLPLYLVASGSREPLKYRFLNTTEAGNLNSIRMLAKKKGTSFIQENQIMIHVGWINGLEKIVAYEKLRLWNTIESRHDWAHLLDISSQ